jgi:hypothetical protein
MKSVSSPYLFYSREKVKSFAKCIQQSAARNSYRFRYRFVIVTDSAKNGFRNRDAEYQIATDVAKISFNFCLVRLRKKLLLIWHVQHAGKPSQGKVWVLRYIRLQMSSLLVVAEYEWELHQPNQKGPNDWAWMSHSHQKNGFRADE